MLSQSFATGIVNDMKIRENLVKAERHHALNWNDAPRRRSAPRLSGLVGTVTRSVVAALPPRLVGPRQAATQA